MVVIMDVMNTSSLQKMVFVNQPWAKTFCISRIFSIFLFWSGLAITAPGYAVDLAGEVQTPDGTNICAIVLASGQFMFSCDPNGPFSLTGLPSEEDGSVKRQIYADGFFSRVDVLPDSVDETVVMTPSGICPIYNTPYEPAFLPGSAGQWITISGNVLSQDTQTSVCAMVLANGEYIFSCDGTGSYSLNIPLDSNGQFKLQVYADGYAPSIQVFDEFAPVNDVRMARAAECQPLDTTSPEITLQGANPVELNTGDVYTEPGVTAHDNVDGDISSEIVIDASAVNTAEVGSYIVAYNVSDSSGNAAIEAQRIVNVTVNQVNQVPVISGDPLTRVTADVFYTFQPVASDPDGDNLLFTITGRPPWISFDPGTGHLSGTPSNLDAGTYSNIVISVTDGTETVSLPAFSIAVDAAPVINVPPVISGTPAGSVTANDGYSFQPAASDADGDPLTFTLSLIHI